METILNRWSGKWKLLNKPGGFGYIRFLDDYYHISVETIICDRNALTNSIMSFRPAVYHGAACV